MFTRILLKMFLKAMIPLVIIVGVMSYGMYMRGGDPAAFFSKMLGNVGNPLTSMAASVQDAGDSLQSMSPIDKSSNKTTVYKWVDENGQTQFGSAPPQGVNATSKTYDNNANTMAATPVQRPIDLNADLQPGFGPDGERLPGVAGMNLPTGGMDPAMLSELLQTMQSQQQ